MENNRGPFLVGTLFKKLYCRASRLFSLVLNQSLSTSSYPPQNLSSNTRLMIVAGDAKNPYHTASTLTSTITRLR
jgi:hypothetical protein